MIRLTLRQLRTQAVIAFGLLAVLALVLAFTGVHLAWDGWRPRGEISRESTRARRPPFKSTGPWRTQHG